MQSRQVIIAAAILFLVSALPVTGQIPAEASTTSAAGNGTDHFPQRPIKVVVPFGAGGGSDTFVRIIQKAIEEHDLLPQPVVIINVPGAGGSIGSRQVLDANPDGYTLMCLHDGIMSAKYAGNTEYGPEAFEPVAGTGEVGTVIAVAADARYEDLEQLLNDAAARPEQVVFSANIGAPSHFAGLMLEAARPGARFRYTQTGGGAKRFAALAGGHIDVSAFSLAEYMQFESAGLRALAYCGKARHPAAPEIPTAAEQGLDVINSVMQFWWAPAGTPPDRIATFANVLAASMETEDVRAALEAIYTDRVFLSGDALKQSLAERERRYANVTQRELTRLPDFPRLVLGMVVLMSLVVGIQSLLPRRVTGQRHAGNVAERIDYPIQSGLAFTAILATAMYVLVMQMQWIGFRTATFLFIFGLGMLLTRWNWKQLPMLSVVAILMGIGLHFVFAKVFAIVLP